MKHEESIGQANNSAHLNANNAASVNARRNALMKLGVIVLGAGGTLFNATDVKAQLSGPKTGNSSTTTTTTPTNSNTVVQCSAPTTDAVQHGMLFNSGTGGANGEAMLAAAVQAKRNKMA